MHIAVVDKTEACAAIPARPSSTMHVLARRGIPIIPFLSFLHFHLINSTTALPLCDEPCSSYATFQGPDQDSYCQDAQTFKCYSPNDTAGGCVQCTQSPELADTTTTTTTEEPLASLCKAMVDFIFVNDQSGSTCGEDQIPNDYFTAECVPSLSPPSV